ncbi:MAG: ATP-NAD kinase family protein [Candidatus Bathyarchaeia archaeon]
MQEMKKLGVIVNPIAGVGGRVGLRGSDGPSSRRALALGAVQESPHRASKALREIRGNVPDLIMITYPSEMGADEAKAAGFEPRIIGSITPGHTTASDTRRAAREMLDAKVDLLLFAGGDGTARDIYESVGEKLPVLGIPAGVKMHSGVFAINPKLAGELSISYLKGNADLRPMEVVDFSEEPPSGELGLKLFGYLEVPYERLAVQGMKTEVSRDDGEEAIGCDLIETVTKSDDLFIIGPGKTAKSVLHALGLEYTLLGVDVLLRKQLVLRSVNEQQLLELGTGKKTRIIVGVIGGQGFLFGRGNQEISPEVIKRVGKENIIVVATESKLADLRGRPIVIDTGDEELDKALSGYYRIVTGYRKSAIHKVAEGRLTNDLR